jgi:ribosomal protein S19E (S16A)
MADEAKAITTDTMAGAENKRDTSGDQAVSVKALRSFHKDGDMKGEVVGPESDPFEVPRHRAAQLRANGLIEYAKDGDDVAIHGEVDAKRIAEKVRLQTAASALPANSKTTPLRNPEVKLAE